MLGGVPTWETILESHWYSICVMFLLLSIVAGLLFFVRQSALSAANRLERDLSVGPAFV